MAEVVIAARGGPEAKQRCAALLGPEQRAALTRAMLADMLEVVLAMPEVARTWVVTPTPDLAAVAARLGAAVILEHGTKGLSAAFDLARATVAKARPNALLALLPADLALLDAAELSALIGDWRPGEVLLVPSHSDGGTGAIVLPAASPLPCAWGPDSLKRHAASAQAIGLKARIANAPSLAFDLDRPADIAAVRGSSRATRARALLRRFQTLSEAAA